MLPLIKVLSIVALVCSAATISPRRDYVSIPQTRASTAEKLNENVIPNNYKIDLNLASDFIETKIFSGSVAVTLEISKAISSFPIHVKNLEIESLELKNDKTVNVNTTTDEANDFLVITGADGDIANGTYTLTIVYTGHLSDTSMRGFYLSSYEDADGVKKYLATTQFEQMDARRAFPCFDEPALKATFDISIKAPNTYTAIRSNSPANAPDSSKTTFKTTPAMSTYLVAFHVSQFTCTTKEFDANKLTRPEICYRPEAKDTIQLALDTAPKVLDKMLEYTQYDYKNMSVNKMTQVAVPDFAAGAMENWGLVTYREADLLWDPEESSNVYKQSVVSVIAHEFSHQWFGDLVTLEWWSDIFLNEGFATYFEYHVTDLLYPDWELQKQFAIDQLQTALVTDSASTALPLSYNTNDPEEIKNRFNDISYNKGGSILRMIHHALGEENFKKALADYISANQFETSTPEKLLESFEKFTDSAKLPENNTFSDMIINWIKKSGYPLLTVKASNDSVTISQKQFSLNDEGNTTWYVPITYSVKTKDFSNTATAEWLTPDNELKITDVLKDQKWFILNNQQTGYYRVQYDETLLQKILDNIKDIDEISRSQLIDDQFNLARANLVDIGDVLKSIKFLEDETSYYTWYSAFQGFSYLLQKTSNSAVLEMLQEYLAQLMTKLKESVPVDKLDSSKHIYTLTQVLALKWACKLGDKDNECVKTSLDLFAEYKNNTNVDPNLRSIVYCNALRFSSSPEKDFDFLWSKYLDTNLATEKVTILSSLGCVQDTTVQNKYLDKLISTSDIRIQDARYVFLSLAGSGGTKGVPNVLEFLNIHYSDLKKYVGEDTTTIPYAINTVANYIQTQTQIDVLTKFSNLDQVDESHKNTAKSAIETATENLKIQKNLEANLKKFFGIPNSAVIPRYHIINIVFVVVTFLSFTFY